MMLLEGSHAERSARVKQNFVVPKKARTTTSERLRFDGDKRDATESSHQERRRDVSVGQERCTCDCNSQPPAPIIDRRTLLKAGASLTMGLAAGISLSGDSRAQGCEPAELQYQVATEDQFVSDALGDRYVKAGEFIVHPSKPGDGCGVGINESDFTSDGVSPQYTAEQCNISAVSPITGVTQLASSWELLNCRGCPWTWSQDNFEQFGPGQNIYISYASYGGERICRACNSVSSSYWYRTSGRIGCWFWSGGTRHPVWNYSTCHRGCGPWG